MKRELKFRQYHQKTGMEYFDWLPSDRGENENWMQFTGLKDRLGKEIYEGDVLQWKEYYVHKRWWRDIPDIQVIEKEVEKQKADVQIRKAAVEIIDGDISVNYSIHGRDISRGEWNNERGGTHGDFSEKKWDFEIIGNIYENPELLKGDTV